MLTTKARLRWAFNFKEWKPTSEEWTLAGRCIQSEEKERIGRFVFSKDAKAAMVGRLLLRKAATELYSIPYEQVKFARTEHGKPYLMKDLSNLTESYDINISHQGHYCVLAAESVDKVGIDIMKLEYTGGKDIAHFFNLMKRQFTSSEWKYILLPSTEKEQLSRFYRLWCLKESYVKAIGTGITIDLQSLDFHMETLEMKKDLIINDTHLFIRGQLFNNWRFQETLLDENHCVAIAIGRDLEKIGNGKRTIGNGDTSFQFLTFDELVKNSVPLLPEDHSFWTDFEKKPEMPT